MRGKIKIAACLSSKSIEWSTPQEFFNELNEEFHFNLDPCSTDKNAKCKKHFTIKDDGLSKDWGGIEYSVILPMAKKDNRAKKVVATRSHLAVTLFFPVFSFLPVICLRYFPFSSIAGSLNGLRSEPAFSSISSIVVYL